MEADIAPKNKPELGALIEGSIGELSPFHGTFGYYAEGVEMDGVTLPQGWQDRVVVVQNENTRSAKGLCIEPHDCAVSKLFAGREKDVAFVSSLLRHKMVQRELLEQRIQAVTQDRGKIRLVQSLLARLSSA